VRRAARRRRRSGFGNWRRLRVGVSRWCVAHRRRGRRRRSRRGRFAL